MHMARGVGRAVFHARRGPHDLLEVGFAARKQHRVIAIDHCPILAPSLNGAIAAAWAIAEQIAGQRKPLDIQATATDAGIDVDVRGSGPLSPLQMADLARVAEQHRLARLTRHGEMIAQPAAPTLRIGRAHVVPPPGAFLQATHAGEIALAKLVEGHCAEARTVADLFCAYGHGVAPSSLFRKAKLLPPTGISGTSAVGPMRATLPKTLSCGKSIPYFLQRASTRRRPPAPR